MFGVAVGRSAPGWVSGLARSPEVTGKRRAGCVPRQIGVGGFVPLVDVVPHMLQFVAWVARGLVG